MKDASDNDSVGASISAETSNATEIATQIQKVNAAPAVTIPLVTMTATQSTDESLICRNDKKKTSKRKTKY